MGWMIKMSFTIYPFLISLIIFTTAFLLFLSFQFIRVTKLELKYDGDVFLHARKSKKNLN